MKLLELFAGTRSIAKAFEQRGHETFSVENDRRHESIDMYEDIITLRIILLFAPLPLGGGASACPVTQPQGGVAGIPAAGIRFAAGGINKKMTNKENQLIYYAFCERGLCECCPANNECFPADSPADYVSLCEPGSCGEKRRNGAATQE